MMRAFYIAAIICVATCISAWMPHGGTPYTLGSELSLGFASNQYQQILAVSPVDATKMVVVSKVAPNETKTDIFNTTNTGGSWATTVMSGGSTGDPFVVANASGVFYATAIDQTTTTGPGFRKSTDGGATWSSFTDIGGSGVHTVDIPCTTIDLTSGAFAGSVYIAGVGFPYNNTNSFYVSRTRDGAATWTTVAIPVSSYGNSGGTSNLGWGKIAGPVVAATGTLLIPAMNFGTNPSSGVFVVEMFVVRSADGGVTFTVVDVGTVTQIAGTYVNNFGIKQSNLIHGPNGAGGDRVYMAYEQSYASAPSSLNYYYSDDDGLTWNGPHVGVQPTGAGAESVTAIGLMINPAGVIGAQWFGINMAGDAFDVFFAYSKDRMGTFSTPITVSSAVSANYASSTYAGASPPFFGQVRAPGLDNTYGAAGPDGKFNVVYQRSVAGNIYNTFVRQVTVH